MKSIKVNSFGGPEVMQLTDVAELEPAFNQIKIKVEAIGVNPVDTYIRAGIYPIKPELPYTPGSDAAGTVIAMGQAVKGFQLGQRVYNLRSITGTYAEEILCEVGQVFALPDNVDFKSGAALGVPYSTAFFALHNRAQAKPGETLLIHGASGAVGLAAIQIARANGLRVIGTAGTAAGLHLLKKQGVIAALNHNDDNYLEPIDELTDGNGVDVVLEMLAHVNLAADLELLAKFGRIVVIGNRGTIEIDPRMTMGKNAAIMGMSLFNATYPELQQIHAAIHAGLSDGRYRPLINCELPLADAAKSHDLVMQNGVNGKIVLIP
jgi:NADPH2:quinone reductase